MEGTVSSDTTEAKVLRVAVGSANPSKLRSVQQALERVVSRNNDKKVTLELLPFPVPSGVPHQPIGDEETKLGAKNRAKAAHESYRETHGKEPHLAVGLEGGLEWLDDELWCMAWMAIYGSRSSFVLECTESTDCGEYEAFHDDTFHWGTAKTGTFALPMSVADLVKGGMELGDADNRVFSRIKSKHGSGTVGLLTDGLIDRSAYYEHALILALLPWIRPDVYPNGVE
jgi:non-canonical (house-cleaning) NTP pyrophosphatase